MGRTSVDRDAGDASATTVRLAAAVAGLAIVASLVLGTAALMVSNDARERAADAVQRANTLEESSQGTAEALEAVVLRIESRLRQAEAQAPAIENGDAPSAQPSPSAGPADPADGDGGSRAPIRIEPCPRDVDRTCPRSVATAFTSPGTSKGGNRIQ